MTTNTRSTHHAARLATVAILAFVMGTLVAGPARVAAPETERAAAPMTESRIQPAVAPAAAVLSSTADDDGQVYEYH